MFNIDVREDERDNFFVRGTLLKLTDHTKGAGRAQFNQTISELNFL